MIFLIIYIIGLLLSSYMWFFTYKAMADERGEYDREYDIYDISPVWFITYPLLILSSWIGVIIGAIFIDWDEVDIPYPKIKIKVKK